MISYCVLSETREIRLQTIYEDHEPYEYTNVIFSGVIAYHFQQDSFGTIIFDIEETDVAQLYAENRERFESGRNYGWPGGWNKSEETILDYLVSSGIKGFALSSSCGMDGWVMAQTMSKIAVSAPS
ncbi:MAG: hypothetical protein H7308_18995 [Chthonomonadaceae bacterium]|nr:hypothetical protein [Chthonomonadaceae bacterium]